MEAGGYAWRLGVRRATMSDVARFAGVSVKTVSRVVNGEPGVHATTTAQVTQAVEQLGFRSNIGARNLRRGTSTATIGLVLEDIANPFNAEIARAVEEVARQFGRRVLTGSCDEEPERERELALEFCARQVDGLLVVPAGRAHGYLVHEMEAGTPVVFLDRPPGDITVDTVLTDNAGGATAAVHHLVAHGHRRVAFFGDAAEIHTASERLRGFREGCVSAGVGYRDEYVAMGPHDEVTIDTALRAIFGTESGATALVTGNNRITVLVLRALASWSARPALVGFDDFELADLLSPPVSVVAHHPEELGRAAAEMLFERMNGDDSPHRSVVFPARVIPRGSAETGSGEMPP